MDAAQASAQRREAKVSAQFCLAAFVSGPRGALSMCGDLRKSYYAIDAEHIAARYT